MTDIFSLSSPMSSPKSWEGLSPNAGALSVEKYAWREFGGRWKSSRFFLMCEWERNGYDDSDWFAVIYDAVKDHLFVVETGTTRFADALPVSGFFETAQGTVLAQARLAWARQAAAALAHRDEIEHQYAPRPERLRVGEVFRTNKQTTCGRYVAVTKTCSKCQGAGKWVNPRNSKDVRDCLACAGQGTRTFTNRLKDIKITVPVGTTVRLVSEPSRFTFGAPLRGMVEILEGEDKGARFQVDVDYLRLSTTPKSEESFLEGVLSFSKSLQPREMSWRSYL